MDKTFSALLDLARFSAAMLVFLHHAEQIFKDNRLSAFASFGHDAVIFFFILSGFVIGYVSHTKEKTLTDYTIARSARLFSVTIPAIILSYLLTNIGLHIFPTKYAPYTNTDWLLTIFSSTFFLNQSWLLSTSIPTNGPYWSISYEAWYYAIFGVFFYTKGKPKYFIGALAITLAGPRILILMPIWLIGVWCYKIHHKLSIRKYNGYIAIAASTVLYIWIRANNIDDNIFAYSAKILGGEELLNSTLGFSKRFTSDFIIAALFVLLFYGFYMVRSDFSWVIEKFNSEIKTVSAYTFSLYLLHFPILVFLSETTKNTWLAMLTCLAAIIVIGHFTETKKYLLAKKLNKFFKKPPTNQANHNNTTHNMLVNHLDRKSDCLKDDDTTI